jgi:dipeptide/tripeptide permease
MDCGSSVPLFLKRLGMPSVEATELNGLFSTIVYITPILGAWVADAYWGRYKTILFFCCWYAVGMAVCTLGGLPTLSDDSRTAFFLIGLFAGVSVGAGGIKSNVVVLGADQFVLPDQKAEQDA